jgi:DNA-binding HxlR family transcriptional regulator
MLPIVTHLLRKQKHHFAAVTRRAVTQSGTPLPGRPVRGSATGRPVMALLDLLGRRWTLRVLWELRDGPVPSFRELQSRCGGVSSSVLSDRLAELREAGIVERADDGYRLSARGAELTEAVMIMDRWAADWRPPAAVQGPGNST